jgi:DNA-binding NarL/FixJ family response regulator
MGISAHTVHVYTKRIYRAYGVEGRTGLTGLWLRDAPAARTDYGPNGYCPGC